MAVYPVVPAWVDRLSARLKIFLDQQGRAEEAKTAKKLLNDYICMPELVKNALRLKDHELEQLLGPNAREVSRGQAAFSAASFSYGQAALDRSITSFKEAREGTRRLLSLLTFL